VQSAGIVGTVAALAGARAARIGEESLVGWLGRVLSDRDTAEDGRLLARPGAPEGRGPVGLQRLELGTEREALVYVPPGYRPDRPAPMVLLLHGAGGNAEHGTGLLRNLADEFGVILLAPASRQATWDAIVGGFGPDVEAIDRALGHVFGRYPVDPERLAVGGFSDGASYALSLGLTNGDLFTHVLAFSPGFMTPGTRRGRPRLFLSHGTHDDVLPIERCSRRLVPPLRRAGHDVTYREFAGPHTVPPAIARQAVEWAFARLRDRPGARGRGLRAGRHGRDRLRDVAQPLAPVGAMVPEEDVVHR
jgi:phospholipase/carboxylesterase